MAEGLVVLVFFVVLGALWAVAQGRRLARQAYSDRQAMVRELLAASADPSLFRAKFQDLKLRPIQIIGESMQLVLTTKHPRTRESRLADIARLIADLDAQGWQGFTPDTRDFVRNAAAENAQHGLALGAIAEAAKHIAAAQRATRPPTRDKYLALSRQPLEAALAGLTLPDARSRVEKLLHELAIRT